MINMQMFVAIKVWNKDGVIIHSSNEESRSLVQAFLAILLANMSESSGLTTDYDNVAGSASTLNQGSGVNVVAYGAKGVVNVSTKGIVIGTSSTAVDMTNSKLVAQIVEGTSSGQMTHQAQTWPTAITIVDPDATFTTNRNFNNTSGGQITVAETGLYAWGPVSTANSVFCVVRDTPSSVDVPNGGGCNVAYTFKISE